MSDIIPFPIKDPKNIKLGSEYIYHTSYVGERGLAFNRTKDDDLDKFASQLLNCSTVSEGTQEFMLYQRTGRNEHNVRLRHYCAKRVRSRPIFT